MGGDRVNRVRALGDRVSEPRAFGDRLDECFSLHGRLCVGIDPHVSLLDEWGLPDSDAGMREFGLRVVDATARRAGIVKLQVAFFERHGSAGYAALERIIAEARGAGLLIIADVKRGDIGTSVRAYGDSWLRPGSPLGSDAITVNPYQGLGSLQDVFYQAESWGKGVFVLAATSNPEAAAVQRAVLQQSSREGSTVAGAIVAGVAGWNATADDRTVATASGGGTTPTHRPPYGSIGVVIGATVDLSAAGIDAATDPPHPTLPVLAPGFGHQGAVVSDARAIYGSLVDGVIVSESRSILAAGPDGIADAVARHADQAAML